MRFLPLFPSAHLSAWGSGTAGEGRQGHRRAPDAPCRFCGSLAAGRQEVFHLNGDHGNDRPENLVPSCTLCHLVQHLDEAARQRSAVLVWMPEMSQAGVFLLARAAQLALLDAGADPSLDVPPQRSSGSVVAAWRALKALRAREEQARLRLLTSSPDVFGAALLALPARAVRDLAQLLDGIRLLPTGRMTVAGQGQYPALLRAWAGRPEPERPRKAA